METRKMIPRDLASKGNPWFQSLAKKLWIATMSTSESPCKEDILSTAKRLCDDYVEDRLIRSGLQLKERKLGTVAVETMPELNESDSSDSYSVTSARQRSSVVCSPAWKPTGILRSLSTSSGTSHEMRLRKPRRVSWQDEARGKYRQMFDKKNPRDVSRVLCIVGEILESRHAGLYSDLFSQLNIHVISELTLRRAFSGVAKEIFADGVSWAKIVSLFAFVGGMAVDCVINGANMYVARLKSWTAQFIENELCDWILGEGGWGGLVESFVQNQRPLVPLAIFIILSLSVLIVAFVTSVILSQK